MTTLTLVRPHVHYQQSYIEAAREFLQEGRKPSWNFDAMDAYFDEYVQMLLDKETDPLAGLVPETVYWSVVNDVFVGRISLRHRIDGSLINYGGHIGYEIRPSARQKGYGTRQCQLVIEQGRLLGIQRLLITCDDDNIGSIKIIEANGGILENKVDNGRASLTRRYWVE